MKKLIFIILFMLTGCVSAPPATEKPKQEAVESAAMMITGCGHTAAFMWIYEGLVYFATIQHLRDDSELMNKLIYSLERSQGADSFEIAEHAPVICPKGA